AEIPAEQSTSAAETGVTEQPSSVFILSNTPATFSQRFSVLWQEEDSVVVIINEQEVRSEQGPNAELPSDQKPADIVLESLRDTPVGTPIEEIRRAADAFGLAFSFMKAVAKIESDFDPNQRTGSYIGLFQLSRYEFKKYGSGDITSPRDNAVAAAYKLATDATLFELHTQREPTLSDLYLIHGDGWALPNQSSRIVRTQSHLYI